MAKFERELLQELREIKEALQALRPQYPFTYVPSIPPYQPMTPCVPQPYIGDPPYPWGPSTTGTITAYRGDVVCKN